LYEHVHFDSKYRIESLICRNITWTVPNLLTRRNIRRIVWTAPPATDRLDVHQLTISTDWHKHVVVPVQQGT
jgi:hypothetical protein